MNTTLPVAICCLLMCLASASALQAHEDTIIALKGTKLVGLPDEVAELDLKDARFRIGNREMKFTPYLLSFFETPHDLKISASWYHREIAPTLPPYIVLHVQPKKRNFAYELMFNLQTLELLDLRVELQESDSSTRTLGVEISEKTRKEIKNSVRSIK